MVDFMSGELELLLQPDPVFTKDSTNFFQMSMAYGKIGSSEAIDRHCQLPYPKRKLGCVWITSVSLFRWIICNEQ